MKTSFTTFAAIIGLMASGAFGVARAQAPASPSHQQSASVGEQVESDLIDWEKAGFDQHTYDVLSYDVFGDAYQKRYAKYKKLRKLHTHQSTPK